VKLVAGALVVLAVVGVAAQASGATGWHRCQAVSGYGLGSLCDGRGRVLFPYVLERNENSGYTQAVTGVRLTGSRRAIVDVHADWGIIQGECGQNGGYLN
jgi:hypothetical protein